MAIERDGPQKDLLGDTIERLGELGLCAPYWRDKRNTNINYCCNFIVDLYNEFKSLSSDPWMCLCILVREMSDEELTTKAAMRGLE